MGAGKRILRPFLTPRDKTLIKAAIAQEETRTTGEIHVHVVAYTPHRDFLEFAQRKFAALGLEKTEHRNGVLILISRWDRRYAIWGDEGLHEKAGNRLWTKAQEALDAHFAIAHYTTGLLSCIREVGVELERHFPK